MDELRSALSRHRDLLERSAGHEFVDHELARTLHRRMASVLDRWHSLPEEHRALITRAVGYLVATDDEEHDLRSPIGFVDDAERVEAMLAVVAPDLLK